MVDQQAALGVATTRTEERLLASLGQLQAAPIRFEAARDVPQGGVLCALPALLVLGLLRYSASSFPWLPGYYPLETIFLAIALLALARVPSLEALRYQPPGEWGRLLGLDNGDSTDRDGYKTNTRRLFSGKLLAIVGALAGEGTIRIRVSGVGPADLMRRVTLVRLGEARVEGMSGVIVS